MFPQEFKSTLNIRISTKEFHEEILKNTENIESIKQDLIDIKQILLFIIKSSEHRIKTNG